MEKQKEIIEAMNWRYATKKFDSNKKVSEIDFDEIIEAGRLAPTSYGLHPFKIIVVRDKEMRGKLKEKAWGQSQVTDASHYIVLCSLKEISSDYVSKFVKLTADERKVSEESLKSFRDMVDGSVKRFNPEQARAWMAKQIYIVLGTMMSACAVKGIDSCPMEGFSKEGFDEVLGLDKKGLKSEVALAVGYRADDDKYSKMKKVRFPRKEIVEEI